MIAETMFKGYLVLNKDMNPENLTSMLTVLTRAKETMISPRMLHFVVEIMDVNNFPKRFIQTFKERFISEVNRREKQRKKESSSYQKRKIPVLELIYSIETKLISSIVCEDDSFLDECNQRPYHHIHLMVIVDIGHNDYGAKEIMIIINKALSRIEGLDYVEYEGALCFKDGREFRYGFLKLRDRQTKIYCGDFRSLYWHDLHTDFEDAVIRASYLCKTEQKKLLPKRFRQGNSFNVTRRRNMGN
ncbi:hypothetical protein F895_03633 [Acinetobacter sp. CIP 64.2]|nr:MULTISPECIES: hypothetical protein [Acinetobacter]ENX12122.1 hypothetical protein F895_03633 [Acinetobacter sp. CIP 64.2]